VEVRLQKYIADCGITSRRKAEDLIVQGRVKINGATVTLLGTKVDPEKDTVLVDGSLADHRTVEKLYILLHKPRGFVTTVSDPQGRDTVMDLVREVSERVYPVGRLDYLSEGLLILTNDGEVANTIMHPRHEVIKVYEVKIFGVLDPQMLYKLREGVTVEGELLKPLSVRPLKQLDNKTWVEIRLAEGKNREIRRICEALGITIDKLRRVAIGNLTINGIAPGRYVYLSKRDIYNGLNLKSDYFSPKKSITIKARKSSDKKMVNDDSYRKYRKDTYNSVMRSYAEKDKEQSVIQVQDSKVKHKIV
jgi:23S rRNA pseudouridine2605 synthase